MLERFKVPKGTEVRVSEASLREATATIFQAVGVPRGTRRRKAPTPVSDTCNDRLEGRRDPRGIERAAALRRAVQVRQAEPGPKVERRTGVAGPRPYTGRYEADAGLGIMLGRASAMNGSRYIPMENSRPLRLDTRIREDALQSGQHGW